MASRKLPVYFYLDELFYKCQVYSFRLWFFEWGGQLELFIQFLLFFVLKSPNVYLPIDFSFSVFLYQVYNFGFFQLNTEQLLQMFFFFEEFYFRQLQLRNYYFWISFLFINADFFVVRFLFNGRLLGSYYYYLTDSSLRLNYTGQYLLDFIREFFMASSSGLRMEVNLGGRYLCYQNTDILAIILLYLLVKCEAIIPLPSSKICSCMVATSRQMSLLQLVQSQRVGKPEYIDIPYRFFIFIFLSVNIISNYDNVRGSASFLFLGFCRIFSAYILMD